MIRNFSRYALEVIIDGALGIMLGILVDKTASYISNKLNLSYSSMIVLQIFFIVLVMYFMKIGSGYLYDSWRDDDVNHGIIFVPLFIASQKNLVRLIKDIYRDE